MYSQGEKKYTSHDMTHHMTSFLGSCRGRSLMTREGTRSSELLSVLMDPLVAHYSNHSNHTHSHRARSLHHGGGTYPI